MTQNPYAGADMQQGFYPEPDRTSIAAVLSLVCSLVCCIPGLGVLGTVLGVFGLIGIGRSNGRVGGKGLAIAGIIIGLLVSALWIGIVFGGMNVGRMMMTKLFPAGGQIITHIENDEFDQARAMLVGNVSQASDEQLIAFREAYMAKVGGYVSSPTTFGELFEGYRQLGQIMQQYQGRNGAIPIPATFDGGPAMIALVVPQSGNRGPAPGTLMPIEDVEVIAPDGTTFSISGFMAAFPMPAAAPAVQPAESPTEQSPAEESVPAGAP
jgi:hypothetical protein